MKKVIFRTFLGFILTISGVASVFLYIYGFLGSSIFLLILAICLLGVGIFTLFHAGRIDIHKPTFAEPLGGNKEEVKSQFQKNNELIAEYNKTELAREKLKTIKLAADAQGK
jgi:hypothetical protein